ncbi:hypothetical protein BS78_10G106800 [Paspalum vaginatum]|nr:hypothetical protein BS78_10G106800 [Paspalum vaginatum]
MPTMQFSKSITETEYKVHLLQMRNYSASRKNLRSAPLYRSEYISYGTYDVAGYDWEVRCYPFHLDLDKEWIAFRLVLRSKAREDVVKATLRCQLVDVNGIFPPFGDQRATYRYTRQEELGPPILLVTHEQVMRMGLLHNDSLTMQCAISVQRILRKEAASVHLSAGLPSTDLPGQLSELLESHKGADIRLVVSGESFMAHKIILAARSPVFMAEFFGPMKESSSGVVEIKDMEPAAFKAMLQFIYTDTWPELAQQRTSVMRREESIAIVQHLLSAADRFGLDRLKLMCEDELCIIGIDAGMVATNLALAEQHNCYRLKNRCIDFIVDSPANLEAVIASEGYKSLVSSCPFPMSELLMAAVHRW